MEDNVSIKDLVNTLPLEQSTRDIQDKIINENDPDEIKKLINQFNLNLAKKNILRVDKLDELKDLITAQIGERIKNRPGEFSNRDLIDYLSSLENSIEKANKTIKGVDEMPAIQFNQVNVTNNGVDSLSKESKENIIKAVQALMTKAKELDLESDNTIEGEIVKENKDDNIQGTDE